MAMARPDHPDFWIMSQILIDHDKVAEGETPFNDQLGRVIDPETLAYVSQQRAMRVRASLHSNDPVTRFMGASALWMDAFMAGAAFQAAKTRDAANQELNEQ